MVDTNNDNIDNLLSDWQRERPELDASGMAVVGRVLTLGRRLEARAGAALKLFELKYTDLDVMATLRRSGAPYRLTPGTLRKSVLITSGAMTACLDRLENRGYIRRIPDPQDRRSTTAELTNTGCALIDQAIEPRFKEAAAAVAGLTDSERDTLANLLRDFGQSMASSEAGNDYE